MVEDEIENLDYSEAGEDNDDEDEGVPSYFHALPSATWKVQESISLKEQGFVSELFLFFMKKEDNWMVVQVARKNNLYKLLDKLASIYDKK